MNLTSTLRFQVQPMIINKSKNSKLKISKIKDENNSNFKKKKFDIKVETDFGLKDLVK